MSNMVTANYDENSYQVFDPSTEGRGIKHVMIKTSPDAVNVFEDAVQKAIRASHYCTAIVDGATFGNSKGDPRAGLTPTQQDQKVITPSWPVSGQTFMSHRADRYSLPLVYPLVYLVCAGGIGSGVS